ncbi:hypothetical protein BJY52DRAFT_1258475, partial [Lactarius psammicola]
ILRTSTIIFTIMFIIASVGGTSVYVSSRLEKFSTCSKTSTRASWVSLTSWAAKRRTPAPAKITFVGENTKPTPSHIAEKA